ncbi:NEAT domain-containing protein [Secundilactobacillus hailunensis]|uniref:NEAT domain-containing protein n=1 Tax=Secundilactobacillus hailunensis TaxID=2559923 RepID=A0ABW1T873_9LACO|nr:NEAT domain-containing protein [Secundilactobacillus hailunensis]
MKKNWVKKMFRYTLLLIFALVSVSALGQVKADALADGSYTVPAKAINKDTGGTSAAGAFLGDTANVVVNNGTYKVSVPITSAGQADLKSASVGQSSVLDGSNLTFTMPDETPKVLVDYHIVVALFHMDMNQSAYEQFDWSKVTAVKGSGSSSSSTTNTDGSSSSSSSVFSNTGSSSSSSSSSALSSSSSSSSIFSSSSSNSSALSSSSS